MSIGSRKHLVMLQNPGPAVPDGDGSYTQTWTDLTPPTLYVSIDPATARDLERVAAGTVIASATQIVKGPYHPQVTTQTRIIFNSRRLNVTAVRNPDERNVTLELVCVEVVQ